MEQENSLIHYGILGMKWGVRRYQNEDGTLTEAGKKRHARDQRENMAKKKENRIDTSEPDPSRWSKEDLTRAKQTIDSANTIVKVGKDLNKNYKTAKNKKDLSEMSNKELQQRIEREQLERRYNELFGDESTTKGQEYVTRTLETTAAALTIASSAVGLALAIKQLKG